MGTTDGSTRRVTDDYGWDTRQGLYNGTDELFKNSINNKIYSCIPKYSNPLDGFSVLVVSCLDLEPEFEVSDRSAGARCDGQTRLGTEDSRDDLWETEGRTKRFRIRKKSQMEVVFR